MFREAMFLIEKDEKVEKGEKDEDMKDTSTAVIKTCDVPSTSFVTTPSSKAIPGMPQTFFLNIICHLLFLESLVQNPIMVGTQPK